MSGKNITRSNVERKHELVHGAPKYDCNIVDKAGLTSNLDKSLRPALSEKGTKCICDPQQSDQADMNRNVLLSLDLLLQPGYTDGRAYIHSKSV